MITEIVDFLAAMKPKQVAGSTGNTVVHRYMVDEVAFNVWKFDKRYFLHVSAEGDWFLLETMEP